MHQMCAASEPNPLTPFPPKEGGTEKVGASRRIKFLFFHTGSPKPSVGFGVRIFSPFYCPMPLRVTVTVRCFGSLLVICTVLFAAPATVGAN